MSEGKDRYASVVTPSRCALDLLESAARTMSSETQP